MKTPDTLIPVADAPGPAAAHAMASALREAGIEAFVFDTAKATLQWEAPAVINPWQVHVRRADAGRAAAVLADNREASVDIDWTEIDVGQPEDATAQKISARIDAPWQRDDPIGRRRKRDAVFRLTGVGIVVWVAVALVSLAATAITILITTF